MSRKVENGFEKFIFASRWVQAPMYFGLIIASILYAYKFVIELWHLVSEVHTISEEALMIGVLTLVDIIMVANLLVMVIIGGYSTFVSQLHSFEDHEDKPDWLDHINAGTLKIKLAAALVGISGIHLLKSFIDIRLHESQHVMWQVIIHVVFLISAIALSLVEKINHQQKH